MLLSDEVTCKTVVPDQVTVTMQIYLAQHPQSPAISFAGGATWMNPVCSITILAQMQRKAVYMQCVFQIDRWANCCNSWMQKHGFNLQVASGLHSKTWLLWQWSPMSSRAIFPAASSLWTRVAAILKGTALTLKLLNHQGLQWWPSTNSLVWRTYVYMWFKICRPDTLVAMKLCLQNNSRENWCSLAINSLYIII